MDNKSVFLHGQLRVLVVKQDWLSRQTVGKMGSEIAKRDSMALAMEKPMRRKTMQNPKKSWRKFTKVFDDMSQVWLILVVCSLWKHFLLTCWIGGFSSETAVSSANSQERQWQFLQLPPETSSSPLKIKGWRNFREGTSWSIDIRDVKGSTGDEVKTSETSEWLQSIDPTQPIMQQFTVVYKHCRRRPNCLYLFKLLCKRLCMVPSI